MAFYWVIKYFYPTDGRNRVFWVEMVETGQKQGKNGRNGSCGNGFVININTNNSGSQNSDIISKTRLIKVMFSIVEATFKKY